MRKLTLIKVLEYYDVPQILVATDAMGIRYLCTLFAASEDSVITGYQYIGVQISEPRLLAFLGGQLDLREAYLHPEVDNALYLVVAQNETLEATQLLQAKDITEAMLPETGYHFDAAEIVDDGESNLDTYQLEVPIHDRNTFSTLVSRMGWRVLSLMNKSGKVAVL